MGASQSSSSESTPLKTAKDDTLLEVEGAAKSDGAKRDGALEAGGSVRIFEARNAGYILQYFAVGMLYRGISATSYGFFNAYLNAPAYVQAASSTLASIPWSFKIFFAILTDAIPIAGYRRRPWMVIGWSIAALALVALALWPLPEPYYCMGTDDAGRPALNQTSVCNPSAREAGMPYAILMMIAAVGFVQADVAADALTVSYARREPLTTRGRTQTMAYLTREIGMVAARLLVGLGMNGPEYNGSFSSGLSLNSVFAILAVPAVAMVPVSWLLIDETPVVSLPTAVAAGSAGSAGGKGAEEVPWTVRNYAVTAYALLRSGAIFDVVCFAFLTSAIGGIGTTAGPMVMRVWADVQALQNQLFSIVGHLLFVLGLSLVRSYFLNSSWRWMLAITLLVVNVLDAPFTFLTVFNVVRNQYFFLEDELVTAIPSSMSFIVSTFVNVEIAEPGMEGITYGVLTTANNLGGPVATALSNWIFGYVTPSLSESSNYVQDDPAFRMTVASSYLVTYIFSFSALLLLPLLPDQKADTHARKASRPKSGLYAAASIGLVSIALAYSLVGNILSIIPSTMCLHIAGGEGCGD